MGNCVQCHCPFKPTAQGQRMCSNECRKISAKAYSTRAAAKRRRDYVAKQEANAVVGIKPEYDYEVGDNIAFLSEKGVIVAKVVKGQSILDVWEDLVDERPELLDALVGHASSVPVKNPRYIVLVETKGRPIIRWPYTSSIRGIVNGSKEESRKETKEKTAW